MGYYLGVIVGVSMLRNALSLGVAGEYAKLVEDVLRDSGSESSYALFNSELISRLADFACTRPNCCAEASLVNAFINSGFKPLTLEFFATDTNASELCAMALGKCFSRVPGVDFVGYVRVKFFHGDLLSGVANLVDALGREVSRYVGGGFEAFIGISGGTKLEVVSSVIVASILRARLAYVDENGGLVVLPRLPLSLEPGVAEMLIKSSSSIPSNLVGELTSIGLLRRGGAGFEVPRWLVGVIQGGRPLAQT